jgi:rhamnogalacturonyl hydrolase YesR
VRAALPTSEEVRSGYSGEVSPEDLWRSLNAVQQWVERNHYRGYEPFDGLSSWLRPLACGNQLAERILQQTIRQSPINLRPLLGVHPKESTKGRGYMAWGYLKLYKATGDGSYLHKAIDCLKWLDKEKVDRFKYHSWSNHFDFVSRGGGYTKADPIIVWTSVIGHAYLEAFEMTGDTWFLSIAESACNWILELPRERTAQGACISYLAHVQSSIHNANLLGAGLLARTGSHNGNRQYLDVARSAIDYSCARQLPDGSWWYAEAQKYHWIDNFHTGYNLDSLVGYFQATGDNTVVPHFRKGLDFYTSHFIEASGRPRYYHNRTYPVDIQCAAQTIDTLVTAAVVEPAVLGLAAKVAAWTIREMQDREGYFYYRRYPLLVARTPMLHWGQATMFKALANLVLRIGPRSNGKTTP